MPILGRRGVAFEKIHTSRHFILQRVGGAILPGF
jgi:hypothetical protein